jgi:LCP family protein required for cell wall assembly
MPSAGTEGNHARQGSPMKKKQWIVIGLVILAAAALTLFLTQLGWRAPSQREIKAVEEALENEAKSMPVYEGFNFQVDPEDLSAREGLGDEWQHILLLGTDTREKELNAGRSDAMLVASIHERTKEIKVTSLVRDMMVNIPGFKSDNRINVSNAFGGPLLAIKTVNELLELNITHYVSVNFQGFINIVNMLGGVDVVLSEDVARAFKLPYTGEKQNLSGSLTLRYARIRKVDNNFGRNERQREVLNALLDKMAKKSAGEVFALLPEVLKSIVTNMSASDILSLLPLLIGSTEGIQTLSLPPEGSYRFARSESDQSIISFNLRTTREAFRAFIAGTTALE